MRKKLVRWIVISQQPFTVTKEPTFQEFVQLLHSAAKLPTANTIKKNIIDCYSTEIKKIQEMLQNFPGRISYTTDIWTSILAKAFLTITAHFINKEWELQSVIVDFIQIWGKHTGENIKEIFISFLQDFEIQSKVKFFFKLFAK